MTDNGYDALIAKLKAFDIGLSDELIRAFAFAFEYRSYAKGAIISQAGPPAREVFYIYKGCVRLYYYRDGAEITAAFSLEGAMTGPCKSMMLQTPNRQVFECAEDCELFMLSRTAYFNLLTAQPEVYKLKSVIAERIMFEQEDIIAFFLSHTPEERYRYLLEQQPELLLRVPQMHLASMIGVSPVSLSRIRRRLVSRHTKS